MMGAIPSGLMGGTADDPMEEAALTVRSREDADAANQSRKALVAKIIEDVKRWEAKHKEAFDKMKRDTKFVANTKGEQWEGDQDKYVANITLRSIEQKVSTLYARNPRVRAQRKAMLDNIVWDGRAETLQTAIATVTMLQQGMQAMGAANMGVPGAIMPPQPAPQPMMDPGTAMAILQEASATRQRRDMLDKIGKTAEVLFHHYIDHARPGFKSQMKQAIRRSATCGVAWVELGFERIYDGHKPETETKMKDARDQLRSLGAELHDLEKGDIQIDDPRGAAIALQLRAWANEPDMLAREGLVFDFPRSWDVIPDCDCRQLVGLIGARKLARRYMHHPLQLKAMFGVDLGESFTAYQPPPGEKRWVSGNGVDGDKGMAVWYRVWDSEAGLVYTVCDGYPDFLCEPAPPDIRTEQFFPLYPIVLHEVENGEDVLFPPSEVDLIRHQQKEINRSREALRQHRIAASPYWLTQANILSDEDKQRLQARAPHEVIELKALSSQRKALDVFQAGPVSPIDPNLYSDQSIMQDVLRVTGAQEANLGPTSGNTATEAGIAESSRAQSITSNTDDLNETLSLLARDACAVMLREVSAETARQIAGPGALWPQDEGEEDFSALVYLDIVAGSMGRPNRIQDVANFERIMPYMLQLPGVNPDWLARRAVEFMDDAVDIDDALLAGIPSIIAINAAMKPGAGAGMPSPADPNGGGGQPTGDPATDPAAQGGEGEDNDETGMGLPPMGQPGMPAPGAVLM